MLRAPALLLPRLARHALAPALATTTPKWTPTTPRWVSTGHHVSPFPDVAPLGDLYHVLTTTATRYSHHVAIECGLTGRSYTYGAMVDASYRYAGLLQRLGVARGDVVAVLAPNTPEAPIVFLGGLIAGANISPINPTFTPTEVARQLSDCGALVVVVDPLLEGVLDQALPLLPAPRPQVVVSGKGAEDSRTNLLQVLQDKTLPFGDHVEVGAEDILVLPYSSGTTGPPKGTRVSHRSLCANLAMVLHPDVFPVNPTTAESQETVLGLMPFFHAWGMYGVLTTSMAHGAKVVTMPKFIPDLFCGLIKKHKVGVLHVVPPLLQFLVGHPMVTPDHLASIRTVMCSAAPTPIPVAHALKNKAKQPIFFQELYGMTETFPTHFTPLNAQEKIGSCGVLLANCRSRVVDLDSGEPLGPGMKGELEVYTPALMSGYHNNEAATREVMLADGFMKTGDVAIYDEDGYCYIVDRIKELIKVKGFQVSPSELEDALLEHRGIADVGVVGVPDERSGEVPRAYVVKRDDGLTEEDIQRFMGERVAKHKQLVGGVRFVDDLPKNLSGKLVRRQLAEMAEKEG